MVQHLKVVIKTVLNIKIDYEYRPITNQALINREETFISLSASHFTCVSTLTTSISSPIWMRYT